MNFKEEINNLENILFDEDFIINKGDTPILFSAPHTMLQVHEDGTVKYNEPYTKAIALYLNKYCGAYSIVKIKDTGIDSNREDHDEYKTELLRLVKKNDIKVIIDLHGSDPNRDYDVEFGTLDNLSASYSTIKELEQSFINNGIINIEHNIPFRGGAITKYLYKIDEVDVIQLEINCRYLDLNNVDLLEQLVKSLVDFINNYKEHINR